jgi:hypothetical protein
MDDLISRQAAIDALDEQIALCDKALKSIGISMKDEYAAKVEKASLTAFRERLEYLPPAQPGPCEDAVSREEVLNCLEWQYPDKLPRTKIMELPPVTPKQRTGYWYPVGMAEAVGGESAQWGSTIAYHRCSECDEQALCEFGQEVLSDFCPHCGAKMVGVYE